MTAADGSATDADLIAGQLIERATELDTIERALESARRGDGRLVVVEGEAGIGKSALLSAVADRAFAGLATLRSAGSELEQLHPYGVVEHLLAPLVRASGGPGSLQGPAEPARAVFDPRTRAATAADPVSVLHALLWLVLDAVERSPMLLIVDDAHWADEPSLRFIASLAHRLANVPVALVVGMRPATSSVPEVMEQIRSHRQATRLSLPRLTERGVATLIRRTGSDLTSAERRDIWSQTSGNPFYVVELLHALPDDGPTGASVPETIAASIRRRLSASGDAARPMAEAIAVLGDEASLPRSARLSGVSKRDGMRAVRHMTERALLEPDRLAFRHPIVRAAVLDSIPAAVRGELHRAAADLFAESGEATAAASHLLSTEPTRDPKAVAILRDAARNALKQGDPGGAATFLERALAERAAGAAAGQLLLDLARAEAALGVPTAPQRFDEAMAHLRQPHERAQARLAQGHALIQSSRWPDGAVAFKAGLAEVDARDVELKSRLEAGFISSAYVGLADHSEASQRLDRILAAPLHDPAHRELAAWSAFQHAMAVSATASEAAALARRAVTGARLEELVGTSQVVELAAGVFVSTGDLAEDMALIDRAIEVARRLNAYQKVGIYSYCRSLPQLLSGRIPDAIADAQTALGAHELGWEVFYPGTLAALAWANLELGDLDAAERTLAMDDERWSQRLDYQFMVRIARGRLRADRGDLTSAIEQFQHARDAGSMLGVRSPTVLGDWQTWCAVALRRGGRVHDAVTLAEGALDTAERWGAPYGLGRAHWALGIARGDASGIEHLRAAVAALTGTEIRLEHLRATVDLGAALRRDGRAVEAREVLIGAADLAHRLGAIALGARARDELAAAGARPRRYAVRGVAALTPSELRVARMAADGRTNREVAQSLFVTPKAVEYHLANAYRKLGIGGRAGLGSALELATPAGDSSPG